MISGVVIDVCGEHGLRFDADYVEDIARFIEAGGQRFAVSTKITRKITSRRQARPAAMSRRNTRSRGGFCSGNVPFPT